MHLVGWAVGPRGAWPYYSEEAVQSVDATLLAERPTLQYEPAEDVEALMESANASRRMVVEALRNNGGDMARALRQLETLPGLL